MAKITVSEAAKRLDIPFEEFMRKLKELGVNVIDDYSELSQEQYNQIRVILTREDAPADSDQVVVKRISGGVIRKRRKAKTPPPKPEPELESEPEPEPEPEILEPAVEPVEDTVPEVVEGVEPAGPETEPEEEIPEELLEELESEAEIPDHEEEPEDLEPDEAFEISEASEEETPLLSPISGNTIEQALLDQRKARVEKEAKAMRAKIKATQAKMRKSKSRSEKVTPAKILERPTEPPELPQAPSKPAQADREAPSKAKKGRRVIEVLPDTSGRRPTTSASRKREAYERARAERAEKLFARKIKRSKQVQPSQGKAVPSKGVKRTIRIEGDIIVSDLARRMGIKAGELIKSLMSMGLMVTINQVVDADTATILGDEYGFTIENVEKHESDFLEAEEEVSGELEARAPVVTIMGHVDHGKTTLLDRIRSANVAEGEAGGITQHIGAYKVNIKRGDVEGDIVFLDTPGHEAFTAMRARGAQTTDIVILIIAADDGVMPQTRESINHAQAAGVPIIVAINKVDRPDAQIDRIRQELTEFNLVSEDWGGETLFAEISAKEGTGVDALLEQILLQAEMLELKANPDKAAQGVVVESRLERGRGPVATILIQEGTLRVGDPVIVGTVMGRVRSMMNDKGESLQEAGPSTPVELMGLGGVPNAGEPFNSPKDDKSAKQLAEMRQEKARKAEGAQMARMRLEDFYSKLQEGESKELRIVLKADVHGSIEAIKDALEKLSTDETKVEILHTAVGAINESDVNLAVASSAIIVAFNIRPEPKAKVLADREKIDIKLYTVIYEMIEDIEQALKGMLEPIFEEAFLGRAEVRNTFHISRVGTVAGCAVVEGKILRNAQARLVRDGVVIWEGKLSSLKRFKDDAREVATGFECGLGLENYNDVKVGDEIECFRIEEKQREA